MHSTKERVLNVSVRASDLSLLSVSASFVWLIELPKQWSWLPLRSPGKISRKHVQPAAIGSSFAMPESSLNPNGIMAFERVGYF